MNFDTYKWPNDKKCAVAISFDFDGESPFLWKNRKKQWKGIGEYEHRKFGPRQGIYRILDLLDELGIYASFFVPGYIAEKYPQAVEAIAIRNHEIGLHGYIHERVDELTSSELEEKIVHSKKVIESISDTKIVGYRSPSWELTTDTLKLLNQHNIGYDSSLMGYDHPYWIDGLAEVPVQWLLDDVVFYRYIGGGIPQNSPSNPKDVIDLWKQELSGIKSYGGLFMLTMHPWVTGRASRLLALKGFLADLKKDPDIWWATCREVAVYHGLNYKNSYIETSDRGIRCD